MKSRWEAVFFDFDGVILDSVNVKTTAFAKMFRQYGREIEDAVVKYHLDNGGVSRFNKFRYYYEKLLKKNIDDELLEQLGGQFSKIALDDVLSAPFVDGALQTLEALKEKKIPAFVASGTPHEELKLIIEKRGLSSYFLETHGSPRTKSDIVGEIAFRLGYDLGKCLFIGDAMTDLAAAKEAGTQFLGIVQKSKENPFPNDVKTSVMVQI